MMEVYKCARSCREVRRFRPGPVAEDVVAKVLRAGMWSPSLAQSAALAFHHHY